MMQEDLEKLGAAVLEAMMRIPGKCKMEAGYKGPRRFPLDSVTIKCIDWELLSDIEQGELRRRTWKYEETLNTDDHRRRNRIALSLRRLLADHRVEKLPSGKRRDMPRWRPLPVLDALAKSAP